MAKKNKASKKVKLTAKHKAKWHAKKKAVKNHAKELHKIGKRYMEHTLKTVSLHKDKKHQAKIKKQLKTMEKALKDLIKLELR